jgi:hypothetical protein
MMSSLGCKKENEDNVPPLCCSGGAASVCASTDAPLAEVGPALACSKK